MVVNGMEGHVEHAYRKLYHVAVKDYERLSKFTQGKQQHSIIGKASWTFAFFRI